MEHNSQTQINNNQALINNHNKKQFKSKSDFNHKTSQDKNKKSNDNSVKENVVFERIVPQAVKQMWMKVSKSSEKQNKDQQKSRKKSNENKNDMSREYGDAFLSYDLDAKQSKKQQALAKKRNESVSESPGLPVARNKWGIVLRHVETKENLINDDNNQTTTEQLPFGFPRLRKLSLRAQSQSNDDIIPSGRKLSSSKQRSQSLDMLLDDEESKIDIDKLNNSLIEEDFASVRNIGSKLGNNRPTEKQNGHTIHSEIINENSNENDLNLKNANKRPTSLLLNGTAEKKKYPNKQHKSLAELLQKDEMDLTKDVLEEVVLSPNVIISPNVRSPLSNKMLFYNPAVSNQSSDEVFNDTPKKVNIIGKDSKNTSLDRESRRNSSEKGNRRNSSEKDSRINSTEKDSRRNSSEKDNRRNSSEKVSRRNSSESSRKNSSEKVSRRNSSETDSKRNSMKKESKRNSIERRTSSDSKKTVNESKEIVLERNSKNDSSERRMLSDAKKPVNKVDTTPVKILEREEIKSETKIPKNIEMPVPIRNENQTHYDLNKQKENSVTNNKNNIISEPDKVSTSPNITNQVEEPKKTAHQKKPKIVRKIKASAPPAPSTTKETIQKNSYFFKLDKKEEQQIKNEKPVNTNPNVKYNKLGQVVLDSVVAEPNVISPDNSKIETNINKTNNDVTVNHDIKNNNKDKQDVTKVTNKVISTPIKDIPKATKPKEEPTEPIKNSINESNQKNSNLVKQNEAKGLKQSIKQDETKIENIENEVINPKNKNSINKKRNNDSYDLSISVSKQDTAKNNVANPIPNNIPTNNSSNYNVENTSKPTKLKRRVGKLIIMSGEERDRDLKERAKRAKTINKIRNVSVKLELPETEGTSITFMSNELDEIDEDPNLPPPVVPKVIFNNPVPNVKSIIGRSSNKNRKRVTFSTKNIAIVHHYPSEKSFFQEDPTLNDPKSENSITSNSLPGLSSYQPSSTSVDIFSFIERERDRISYDVPQIQEKIESPQIQYSSEGDHFNMHSNQDGGHAMLF